MNSPEKTPKKHSYDFEVKHSVAIASLYFHTIQEAFKMLADARGDDGWHVELYDTIQEKLPDVESKRAAGISVSPEEAEAIAASRRALDGAFGTLVSDKWKNLGSRQ